ncbi:MAG TPA: hypothetical protein VHA82_08560 [Ramlibacter sp.]|uniref:hypothetical protein n=1 Tax=Ramlibacter sp. TaxID=1917967 RepID=UPI002CC763C2|nr:hypothetical protein [Ramlibacter sp.]HVZ43848.1 hypothetical protein [Ramlibacter sp.]
MTFPSFQTWMRETAIAVYRREPTLVALDAWLEAHTRFHTPQTSLNLDVAIRNYKAAVPGWERSKRNRTGIMTRTFQAAINDVSAHLDQRGCVWSPLHAELTIMNAARDFRDEFHLHPVWQGGTEAATDLSQFSINSTIYLLAHGHGQMPVFMIDKQHFTPEQFVELLIKDKLRREHRNFTMLVCHAGESVNTKAAGNALWAIQQKNNALKAQIETLSAISGAAESTKAAAQITLLEGEKRKVAAEWGTVIAGPAHRHAEMFESFEQARMTEQLLPLAAQLSAAMKHRGFSNFALRSFKAPVRNSPTNGQICLDLEYARSKGDARLTFPLPAGHDWKNVPIALVPDWVVIWR